eukprot:TRINITY_DN7751_c0_g1_i1.p1 TRINITY_DN7751_c0_g1~~TRINITY_DN7751_c0_g1_i1.p1  ORF type:complete len:212 (+),score=44.74 TRINITY_DN7751_c0_g1_i1:43-678(+)
MSDPALKLILPQDGHTLLTENDIVKVFETYLPPGKIIPMHSHIPHVRYCYSAGENLHTYPNGETELVIDKVGDWEVREALEHSIKNVGTEMIHSLIFEFKRNNARSVSGLDGLLIEDVASGLDYIQISDTPTAKTYEILLKPGETVGYLHRGAVVYNFGGSLDIVLNEISRVCVHDKKAFWFELGNWELRNTGSSTTRVFVAELKGTASKL